MKEENDSKPSKPSSVTDETLVEFDEFGFVKNYLCPKCESKVKLSHTDDVGTKFFKCEKCGEYSTKLKSRARKHLDKACQIDAFFDEHNKFIPKLLADEIMSEHNFVTMMDNEGIYVYLDGYYQPLGEVLIKKECKDKLLDEYRKNRVTEVIDYIKASTYAQRREEPPNLIPLENGVLDLDSNPVELKSYSPDLMFFNKIPVKYNPEADCPNIKKFHQDVTGESGNVAVLEEVLGFCLYRDYFSAKALMLVGGGSNGKSTWLSLAKTFLGHKNVSGRGLQDLEEHRFAKADLHTKLANIYADLPDKALQRTGMFKMLTGRDLIAAEKKFRDSFHFVNYAKLMFSANKVPEAYDDTAAFFRRWIIIVFPNVFIGEDADPHILDKLTTEKELSGLLNLTLAGLKRLLENGAFSYSKTTEEIKEDYIRKSSPIAAFVMDCLETDSDTFIVKKELYNVFTEYCRQLSLPTVTQDTFFKNLPQHAVVMDYRPTVENKRFHTFKGLRYSLNNLSNLSNVSRVFYTLIEKRGDYEGYEIEELNDHSFIKVQIPLDSMDSLDTKLKKTRAWIIDNKDSNGLIDATRLAEKITSLGEKPQKIVNILKKDGVIAHSPKIGKFVVV